jgi:hypothetical protein
MLRKALIVVSCLPMGVTTLQADAFARGGGGHGGGHGGGFGGHHGGFGQHGYGHEHFHGFPFVDFGDWPYAGAYDDYGDCYWTRTHRYICE